MVSAPRTILLVTTVLSFCTLYAPQPILPSLARDFDVDPAGAALLVSITLAPLAVAPIAYGYVLGAVPARRMLMAALAIMAASQLAFALAEDYRVALAARAALGLALPAAFTALMTATAAAAPPERVRQAMGAYIAATIVGGFAGRAAGGFLTTAFGWQAPFLLLAALLVANVVLASRLPEGGALAFSRPRAAVLRAVVTKGHFLFSYLTIFCVFFVFAGVLNVLPFRLEAIEPGIREADIALVYSGYMIGIAAALGASRVSALLGGERRALAAALAVYLAATAGFVAPSVTVLLANVFLFSIGMFAVHSLLSALVNQRAAEARPVVNGMYIAVYYAGGSLGSWLPALAYGTIGWNALLAAMAAAVLAALWLTRYIFRADREEPGNG